MSHTPPADPEPIMALGRDLLALIMSELSGLTPARAAKASWFARSLDDFLENRAQIVAGRDTG